MAPTMREIVWQIAALHELYPKDTVSDIAGKLMLSPLYIINALEEGERMEMFQRQRDKKGTITEVIDTIAPIDWKNMANDAFGLDIQRLQGELFRAIDSANSIQQDLEDGRLQAWCR